MTAPGTEKKSKQDEKQDPCKRRVYHKGVDKYGNVKWWRDRPFPYPERDYGGGELAEVFE